MLYDIQRVERNRDGIPALHTDLVSGSRRRIYDRARELNNPARRQQCRVVDQQGHILTAEEIHAMR